MYHQSVTLRPGLLRSCSLLPLSERRLDCTRRPTAYRLHRAILRDTVTKCPSWVSHAQSDTVCVCVCVWGLWVCVRFTISKRKRQKTWEACSVYWPGQSLTKQRVEGNKKGRTRQMGGKKMQRWKSVEEMACLCSVPLDLNWAASKGAITCVSLTAHSH